MIESINEETFELWLKEHPMAVVLGWLENCSHCERFKPIFAQVAEEAAFRDVAFASIQIPRTGSEFKRRYMRTQLGEKNGAPCTFLFENGELITRRHGPMSSEELRALIRQTPVPPHKKLEDASLVELKAFWLDQILNIEHAQATIRAIQAELVTRNSSLQRTQ